MLRKFPMKRLTIILTLALTYSFSVGIVDSCQSADTITLSLENGLETQSTSSVTRVPEQTSASTAVTTEAFYDDAEEYAQVVYASLNFRKAEISDYEIYNEIEVENDSGEAEDSTFSDTTTASITRPVTTTTSLTTTTKPATTTSATTTTTTSATTTTTTTTTSATTTTSEAATTTTTAAQTTTTSTAAPPVSDEMLTVYDYNTSRNVTASAYDIVCQVVYNEIGSGFALEAIKAQAVAAYTYIKFYNKALGQTPKVALKTNVPQKVKDCVAAVSGVAIYYNGSIINSTYCASSAGYTASAKSVWGTNYSYLSSVVSEYDYLDPNFGKTKVFTSADIQSRVYNATGINLTGDPSGWFTLLDDSQGGVVDGAYVGKMLIGGQSTYQSGSKTVTITGRVFRESIMNYSIRSTSFSVSYDAGSDTFTFTTNGYGHGVGMPQYGAQYYALYGGYTYDQILTHYYSGTEVH